MSLSLKDALVTVTQGQQWGSIDTLRESVLKVDEFDLAAILKSDDHAQKLLLNILIRREIRELKDETGFPVLASIKRPNPETGQPERVYMQESMFEQDEYVQVVQFHADRANYHAHTARAYADRGQSRYGEAIQLPLDFNPQ